MSTWIVGQGGLIGSAVRASLLARGQEAFPAVQVPWGTSGADASLTKNVRNLVKHSPGNWSIIWCAGAGVTGTDQATLDAELQALNSVVEELSRMEAENGSFVFCSSVGGVYGGSSEPPFSELTTPMPISDYGRARLTAENRVLGMATSCRIRVAIARLTNVYGPGQNFRKSQGLITQLALSAIRQQPITIYVPFDTIRNYIFVSDAAEVLVDLLAQLKAGAVDSPTVKIVASNLSYSIAAVIGEFSRLPGPRPLVVQRSTPESHLQARDIRVRSQVLTALERRQFVNLSEGIMRTFEDVSREFSIQNHRSAN